MTTGARRNMTEPRDDAGELALEAHLAFLGHRRFSESSAAIRQRNRAAAAEPHELDALMATFCGG